MPETPEEARGNVDQPEHPEEPEQGNGAQFEALLEYLRLQRGFDLDGYKPTSLKRRINKRMAEVDSRGYGEYIDYLEVHPDEFIQLFNTILINVTSFFRDSQAWEYLAGDIVPRILADKAGDGSVRVWSAGCASGEEAYTLAIVLAEALGDEAFCRRVKIYATDIDDDALRGARHATYTAKQIEPVPESLRQKYFEKAGSSFIFVPELRKQVIFGRHDLLQDAPISRLDLLVCRNTLMYFNAQAQSRILAQFRYALNDSGYLFLGRAEMLLTHSGIFMPVDLKHRMFVKVPRKEGEVDNGRIPIVPGRIVEPAADRGRPLLEAAFAASAQAAVVVDADGNMINANGRARAAFGLNNQDIGRPLKDLEISYRPVELRSLIEDAGKKRNEVRVSDVVRALPAGGSQHFDVRVRPLFDATGRTMGFAVLYEDISENFRLQEELNRSNQERETANEELQSANEELETTNEELQSTIEELQTTNEELQSTNEEMETMNEELQSSNDEMRSVNRSLIDKTREADSLNAFLRSTLESMRLGVVVVDHDLRVVLWNDRAEDLWGVRSDEAVGKSLMELDIGLPVAELKAPIEALFAGTSDRPEVTLKATNRKGRSILCRVSCTMRLDEAGKSLGGVLTMEEQPSEAQG